MKRTHLALFLFFMITAIVLCVATAYLAANMGKAKQGAMTGLHIMAQELPEKPQTYFLLTDADTYVLQAIDSPGNFVYVGDWNNTQIDDMVQSNHTNNIEFNNNYYVITLGSQEPASRISDTDIQILIAGWVFWGIAATASIIVVINLRRRNKP